MHLQRCRGIIVSHWTFVYGGCRWEFDLGTRMIRLGRKESASIYRWDLWGGGWAVHNESIKYIKLSGASEQSEREKHGYVFNRCTSTAIVVMYLVCPPSPLRSLILICHFIDLIHLDVVISILDEFVDLGV